MPRYVKRVFTAEAVAVGVLFCSVIGLIAGLTGGLLLQSIGFGVFAGIVVCLFSLDVIFRGSHE